MNFSDTHTHLYAEEFNADADALILRAVDMGISHFFLPNVDSETIAPLYDLCSRFSEHCFPMMGLHPCSVKDNYIEELRIIEQELGKGGFCAIGEIGLDFYWDKTFVQQQEEVFTRQITWASELNLPVSIHSRLATARAIELIKQNGKPLRGIFHCFGGTLEEAHEIISLGMYLGIGGVLTFKNSGLDNIIKQIDLNYLVLETDAPYLAPVPHRGKRNIPEYLLNIAQHLAVVKSCTLNEVAQITTQNAKNIFSR
jgi:TatD DNase family protein